MAVLDYQFIDVPHQLLCSFWLDPKRYRCTIWRQCRPGGNYSVLVRTMVDRDRARLFERVDKWLAVQVAPT